MKVYKLDEYTREIKLLDIDGNIETYHRELQCDCLDFATFAVAPGEFRIIAIVDDCGAYLRQPTCYYPYLIDRTCFSPCATSELYGSVIFARQYEGSPDLSDIEPHDLVYIKRCMI